MGAYSFIVLILYLYFLVIELLPMANLLGKRETLMDGWFDTIDPDKFYVSIVLVGQVFYWVLSFLSFAGVSKVYDYFLNFSCVLWIKELKSPLLSKNFIARLP